MAFQHLSHYAMGHTLIICLLPVIWFQLTILIHNYLLAHKIMISHVHIQYEYFAKRSNWPKDEKTLQSTWNEYSLVWFYGISTIVGYFNAKSYLYIYIQYIWFDLVWFYGISTIVGYFNAKSYLYIYIQDIWFDLVWFYGISTIVGYLMPNPIYTYTFTIYDLIWFAFMAYQPL